MGTQRASWHVRGHTGWSMCRNTSCAERSWVLLGEAPEVTSLFLTGALNWVGGGFWAPHRALPSSGSLSILQPGRCYREGLPYQGHPGCSPER